MCNEKNWKKSVVADNHKHENAPCNVQEIILISLKGNDGCEFLGLGCWKVELLPECVIILPTHNVVIPASEIKEMCDWSGGTLGFVCEQCSR